MEGTLELLLSRRIAGTWLLFPAQAAIPEGSVSGWDRNIFVYHCVMCACISFDQAGMQACRPLNTQTTFMTLSIDDVCGNGS